MLTCNSFESKAQYRETFAWMTVVVPVTALAKMTQTLGKYVSDFEDAWRNH